MCSHVSCLHLSQSIGLSFPVFTESVEEGGHDTSGTESTIPWEWEVPPTDETGSKKVITDDFISNSAVTGCRGRWTRYLGSGKYDT